MFFNTSIVIHHCSCCILGVIRSGWLHLSYLIIVSSTENVPVVTDYFTAAFCLLSSCYLLDM